MPNFGAGWNVNPNTASTTVPMAYLTGTAAISPALYEVNAGANGVTADNEVSYGLTRGTSAGTTSTTVAGNDLSMGAASAAGTLSTAWNINPTITSATAYLLYFGMHQRATYRWVAYDYTKMIRTGCGASTFKGIALLSVTVSSAFNAAFSYAWEE